MFRTGEGSGAQACESLLPLRFQLLVLGSGTCHRSSKVGLYAHTSVGRRNLATLGLPTHLPAFFGFSGLGESLGQLHSKGLGFLAP